MRWCSSNPDWLIYMYTCYASGQSPWCIQIHHIHCWACLVGCSACVLVILWAQSFTQSLHSPSWGRGGYGCGMWLFISSSCLCSEEAKSWKQGSVFLQHLMVVVEQVSLYYTHTFMYMYIILLLEVWYGKDFVSLSLMMSFVTSIQKTSLRILYLSLRSSGPENWRTPSKWE